MNRKSNVVETDRRGFLKSAGTAAVGLAASGAVLAAAERGAPTIRMGVDAFSLGAQNWTPFQTLEWASKLKVNMVHFSEVRFLGSPKWQEALAPDNLKRIRDRAAELEIDLEIGMRSICPTSAMFDKNAGTAEEQLGRMIDAAKIVRSPIVRAVLGSAADRRDGIDRHIDDTVAVLKNVSGRLRDANVKVAIENHAGDMQARELKRLIESAGPEHVGVCLDSGNPVWTIEDPHLTLETLAPYVLTSHMSDSALWNTPQGAAVRWTRMGEGNMGMEDYLRTYIQKCPGRAVSLEVIVSGQPRMFNYRDPKFWDLYRNTPAWEFARFLTLCDKGTPSLEPAPDPAVSQAARQLAKVEASIKSTQAFLAKL
jgi:sugar phosphate isomerase/epimerase